MADGSWMLSSNWRIPPSLPLSPAINLLFTPSLFSAWFWTSLLILVALLSQIASGKTLTKSMAGRTAFFLASVLYGLIAITSADQPTPAVRPGHVATTSFRPIFTVPAAADNGANVIPNIRDPEAVNAQDVCPGYKASNVARTPYGVTASLTLAGKACNVYGTDIEALNLTVEYQSSDRLHVEITPTYIGAKNSTWFVLPESLVEKPGIDADAAATSLTNDLNFIWSNDPTFSFTVIRGASELSERR